MNQIEKLENEINKIKKFYIDKKENLILDKSNHFTIMLGFQNLSKEFVEKETKNIVDFTNNLIKQTESESIQKEMKEKTEYFLKSFSIELSIG
jgi:imidazoleglycerol phosphate synthase glutamine amidotransferase subunit HisH